MQQVEITERVLAAKAKAPRVTQMALEQNIIAEHYFTAYEGRMGAVVEGTYESVGSKAGTDLDLESLKRLTFCVLVLANGYTVHGVSACASLENFNQDIGRSIARKNAVDQIWPLMDYELKTKLLHNEMMESEDLLGAALSDLTTITFGTPGLIGPQFAKLILDELVPQSVESNEDIARVCHEANRSWCEMNEDHSQLPWEEAPQWQRDSAIAGVMFLRANPDAGDSATHDSWAAQKIAEGWTYGEVKDPGAKTHPCLVPFEELPHAQQFKDKLFRSIVRSSLSPALTPASQRKTELKVV